MPPLKRTYLIDGAKVRELRVALVGSQTLLAKRAGIARSYLVEIEAGQKQPSDRVAARIARELRKEVWELALPEELGKSF